MLRVALLSSTLLCLGACASSRDVQPIPRDEAFAAFMDVKNQIIDYQGHMAFLAANPDQDPALRGTVGGQRICGTEGGVRLDITSATVNFLLETGSSAAVSGTTPQIGSAITDPTIAFGGGRSSSISYVYAVELAGEVPPLPNAGKSPLSDALTTLRENIIRSQYAPDSTRGCLRMLSTPGSSYAVIKLVRTRDRSAGFMFAIGPVIISPSVKDSFALANTMNVSFRVSAEGPPQQGQRTSATSNRSQGTATAATAQPDTEPVQGGGNVVFGGPLPVTLGRPLVPANE